MSDRNHRFSVCLLLLKTSKSLSFDASERLPLRDHQTAGFGLNQATSQTTSVQHRRLCCSFQQMPWADLVPVGVGSDACHWTILHSFFLKVMHCPTLSSEEMSDLAEGLCAGIWKPFEKHSLSDSPMTHKCLSSLDFCLFIPHEVTLHKSYGYKHSSTATPCHVMQVFCSNIPESSHSETCNIFRFLTAH